MAGSTPIFYVVTTNTAHADGVRGDACRRQFSLNKNIKNYPSIEAIEDIRRKNPRVRNKKVNLCKKCFPAGRK